MSTKETLSHALPSYILNNFLERLEVVYNKRFRNIKNINKSRNLVNSSLKSELFTNNEKWFKNVSDFEIPSEIIDFFVLV